VPKVVLVAKATGKELNEGYCDRLSTS